MQTSVVRIIAIALVCLAASACTSLTSTPNPSTGDEDGLVYYLPKKDLLATIVVTGSTPTAVTFTTSAAYPDLSRRFVLKQPPALLSRNVSTLEVDPLTGLLKSGKATMTPKVADALTGLAETAGTFKPMTLSPTPSPTCTAGTHTFVLGPGEQTKCGLKITVAKMLPGKTWSGVDRDDGTAHSGVFYRQQEPYLLQAETPNRIASILYSPNDSPTMFLPVPRGVFAESETELAFTDGMPSKYGITRDSELAGALKLPASIIAAYFGAVGKMFDAFGTNSTKEAAAIGNELKLELAKRKFDACIAAIQAEDAALISSLECGK